MRRFLLLISVIFCVVNCINNEDFKSDHNPDNSAITKYKIGDLYNVGGVKGVVYKTDKSGQSGMILSFIEPENMLSWSTEWVVTGAQSTISGEQNMVAIYNRANWRDIYRAFAWCETLGKGWYIPSIDELEELIDIANSDSFTSTLSSYGATPFSTNGYYISSTEVDKWTISIAKFTTGERSENYKQFTYNVRAIRTF